MKTCIADMLSVVASHSIHGDEHTSCGSLLEGYAPVVPETMVQEMDNPELLDAFTDALNRNANAYELGSDMDDVHFMARCRQEILDRMGN